MLPMGGVEVLAAAILHVKVAESHRARAGEIRSCAQPPETVSPVSYVEGGVRRGPMTKYLVSRTSNRGLDRPLDMQ